MRDPAAAVAAGLDLGSGARGTLVFVTGFLVTPEAYRALLTPLGDDGYRVVVPRLSRRGPRVMFGAYRPSDEAAAAAAVVEHVRSDRGVGLGGHSRGGFVAWLAATRVEVTALALVDPVSGGGGPWSRPAPLPVAPTVPTLIVGAGLGGRCAPAGRNHVQFAAAAPHARHVVVPDCGHADVLDGRDARLGRHLCAGAPDPGAARAAVSEALRGFWAPGGRAGTGPDRR